MKWCSGWPLPLASWWLLLHLILHLGQMRHCMLLSSPE